MIELGYDNCLGQGSPADAKIIGMKIAGEQDIHTTSSSLLGRKDNKLPLKGTTSLSLQV